ncbi:hypothetical protein [Methanobacterium sp.]|jgi:hypothetical protein|uniref:hypothetical protein n=1 Tax=Methanobacterium sp. TaxID=2164 RepID=UPI0031586ED9
MEVNNVFKILKIILSGSKINQFSQLIAILKYHYYNTFKPLKTFYFNGKKYNYFYHMYNTTWENERAVEVPIVWEIVKKRKGKRILEVGNVFSNYFSVNYDIVDKYDVASNVINCDVCEFKSAKNYDLIVTISTLEHVGFDENSKEPTKILWAIQNLESLLNTNGELVVTLPIGYNSTLDKLLNNGKIQFTETHYLKRITKDNQWIEVNWDDIANVEYGHPFNSANGLIVGIIKKNESI